MEIGEVLSGVRESMSVKRVYGEPYEKDGVTLIPAASVRAGGGGGQGESPRSESLANSQGTGFGITARPVGAYAIQDGKVKWVPVFDVSRIVTGAQIVVAIGFLTLRAVMKYRARSTGRLIRVR